MSLDQKDWLSLTEASEFLGVHPSTLRCCADLGSIPCFRTPATLMQNGVGYTRQEMGNRQVWHESW
jgi:hypothetical protein